MHELHDSQSDKVNYLYVIQRKHVYWMPTQIREN